MLENRAQLKRLSSEYLREALNRNRGSALAFVSDLAESKKYSMVEILDMLSLAQQKVGSMWASGTATTADEHFVTETTLDAIGIVSQKLKKYFRERRGTALLTNFIEGEFHNIGLKMFAELLRYEGWDVELYGSTLSVAQVFNHIEKSRKNFDLICISLTMGFNLIELRSVLKILRTNVLTSNSKTVVGSQLFKTKKNRDSLIDEETRLPLADMLASSFEQGLKFIQSIPTKLNT